MKRHQKQNCISLLLACVVLVSGCTVLEPSSRDDRSPLQQAENLEVYDGRIAFAGAEDVDDLNHDLYVVRADSGEIVRLTTGPENDCDPVWSPDGTRIAFTRSWEGIWGAGVCVVNWATKEVTDITSAIGTEAHNRWCSPAWSPDGTEIAFSRMICGEGDTWRCELWLSSTDGSNPRRLAADGDFYDAYVPTMNPLWSPDGSRIAFSRALGQDRFHICTIAPDGGELVDLTESCNVAVYPEWSPDGEKIAFIGPEGVTIVNRDSGGERVLPDTQDVFMYVRWSPDGQRIALVRTCEGREGHYFEVCVMSVDSGNMCARVGVAEADVAVPSFSPDGSRIAFVTCDDPAPIRVMYPDGTGIADVVVVGGATASLAWSPDGRALAVPTNEGLISISLDTNEQLVLADNMHCRAAVWAPMPMADL